ncbi:MAG: hypothetical protein AB8B96_02725 [Lysobacterales bacterium]
MSRHHKSGLSLALWFALLAGVWCCTGVQAKKIYTEPNAAVGQCADQCNVSKMQCRAHAKDQYDYCKAVYQQMVRQFNYCRQRGGNCLKPDRCPIMQTKVCTNTYDLCFESCGGIIEDSKEIKKRQKAEAKAAKAAEKAARRAAKEKADSDDPGE